MNKTLAAAFAHEHEAEQARRALLHAGFSYAAVVVHSGGLRTGSALDGQSTVQEDHGGIGGWFRSLFNINEDDPDAALYAEAARRGHFVLSVHVNDAAEAARAEQLLSQHQPIDLNAHARQWRAEDRSEAAGAPSAPPGRSDASTTIPVVQETLQVGKRAVRRGGLRVLARLVETPVRQAVRLREEHVVVERRAVDRPATEADFAVLQAGASLDLTETSEEAVVVRQSRVIEEIELGKRVTEREQIVADTVRRTEVEVERLSADTDAAAASAAQADPTAPAATPGSPASGNGQANPR